jgi:hypothetical protein
LTDEERLRFAQLLGSQELPVFPMVPNKKRSAIKDWRKQATTNPALIQTWWSERYKGYNVGVATGRGLLVLDVDTKKGKLGLESLERLEKELKVPWGLFRVRTPSGGLHVYLQAPKDFTTKQRVNNLPGFPGIDITHCVASLGSSIDGVPYEIVDPPSSCQKGRAAPPELIDLCRQAVCKTRKHSAEPVVPLDTEHAINCAIDYLSRYPIVREFEGSDYKTFSIACKLRARGISEETCFDLICRYLNEAGKTEPPFDPEWIEKKVENAFDYGSGAPGDECGIHQFDDVSEEVLQSERSSWPKPADLWEANADPPDLPTGIIPRLIERYARDRGGRLGVEPGAVAAISLVSFGSLIHASNCIQVRQNDPHWTECPILWAMLVGNPGSNKTATLMQSTAPIRELEKEWNQAFTQAMAKYLDQKALAENKKIASSLPKPKRRRKTINDATTESVAEILAENEGGLLLLKDELSGLFGGMDAYRVKGERDRPFWIEAKEGKPFFVDRKGKDPIIVPRNAVSIVGAIQPDKIRAIAAKLTPDGLLQRFWPVWLKRTGEDEADELPDEELDRAVLTLAKEISSAPANKRYRFASEAGAELKDVQRLKDKELARTETGPYAEFIDKLPGAFARLALVFHFLDWYSGELSEIVADPPPEHISADTARRARLFLTGFIFEARRGVLSPRGAAG